MKKIILISSLLFLIINSQDITKETLEELLANNLQAGTQLSDIMKKILFVWYFPKSRTSGDQAKSDILNYLKTLSETSGQVGADCAMFTDLQTLFLLPKIYVQACEKSSDANCPSWYTNGTSNPVQYYLMNQFCGSVSDCMLNNNQNSMACKIFNAINNYFDTATKVSDLEDMLKKDLIPLFSANNQPNIFQAVMARFNYNSSLYNWWSSVNSNFNNSGDKFFLGLCLPDQSTRSQQFQTYIVPLLQEIAPACSWYTAGNLQEITDTTDAPIQYINFDNSPKALSSGGLPFEDFSSANNIINSVLTYYFSTTFGALSCLPTTPSGCPWTQWNNCFVNQPDSLVAFWNTIMSPWFAKYIAYNSHKYTNNGQPVDPSTIYEIYKCTGLATSGQYSQYAKNFCGCSASKWGSTAMWNLIMDAIKDKTFIAHYAGWAARYYNGNTTSYWPLGNVCGVLGGRFDANNCYSPSYQPSVGFF